MVIDAYEYRKVENFDVPGAYLHTDLPKGKFKILLLERNFMDIVCDINHEYTQHVRFRDCRKIFISAFSMKYMG